MRQFVLPKGTAIQFAGNKLTEHNRQPIQMTSTQIENAQRMADGTLRKYHVATKHTWSIAWDIVPGSSANTVDGLWGAKDIETFYFANPGAFTMTLNYNSGIQTYSVFFDSFENDLTYRFKDDYYTMTITLEEA